MSAEVRTDVADTPPPEKRPPWRPTKYRRAFCQQIVELGRQGYSKVEIAAELGIHRNTLGEWAAIHPEFAEALDRALLHSQAWWEADARKNLKTSSYQSGLWIKIMACRFPGEYRDATRHEIAGVPDAPPVKTEADVRVSVAAGEAYLAMLQGGIPTVPTAPSEPEAPAANG